MVWRAAQPGPCRDRDAFSVVTNALRLRRFKQRHPPRKFCIRLRERVADYAYLVGIALVAVVVGAAALYFARSEMGSATPMPTQTINTQAVSRTIEVETTDALRFVPDHLDVRAGETVAFESATQARCRTSSCRNDGGATRARARDG
jgi:hypothetical protein